MVGGLLITVWLVNQNEAQISTRIWNLDQVFIGGGLEWHVFVRIMIKKRKITIGEGCEALQIVRAVIIQDIAYWLIILDLILVRLSSSHMKFL
jgi:hypothetical protein